MFIMSLIGATEGQNGSHILKFAPIFKNVISVSKFIHYVVGKELQKGKNDGIFFGGKVKFIRRYLFWRKKDSPPLLYWRLILCEKGESQSCT